MSPSGAGSDIADSGAHSAARGSQGVQRSRVSCVAADQGRLCGSSGLAACVLNREGLAKAISAANFSSDPLVDLIHNKITPAVNQVETHPYFQHHRAGPHG